MVKIFPQLTDKIFPGCGYNYFGSELMQSSPFTTINQLNSSDYLNFDFDENTFSIPTILSYIKNGKSEEYFKANESKQICSSLAQKTDIKNYSSGFIKTENLKWTFNPNNNIFRPLVDSHREFVQKYGDTFVKSVSFGKNSAFQINLSKSVFEEGIDQNHLQEAIDWYLYGKTHNHIDIDELTELADWFKTTASDQNNCNVYELSHNDMNKPKNTMTINDLKSLLSHHQQTARTNPNVVEAVLDYYPEQVVAGNVLESRQPFIKRFEEYVAPNCVDLFQSAQYLEQINGDTKQKQFSSALVKSKLLSVERNIRSAKYWIDGLSKKHGFGSEEQLLDLPDAAEILSDFIEAEQENEKLVAEHKNGFENKFEEPSFGRGINDDLNPLNVAELSGPYPNTKNLTSETGVANRTNRTELFVANKNNSPERTKIEMSKTGGKTKVVHMGKTFDVTRQNVEYRTFVGLCTGVTALLKNHSKETLPIGDEGIPKNYIYLSTTLNLPNLSSIVPGHLFGPGIPMEKCPSDYKETNRILKVFKREHGIYPPYIFMAELEEKDYIAKDICPPEVDLHKNCQFGPRAVSAYPDNKRFFIHYGLYADLEKNDELNDPSIADILDLYNNLNKDLNTINTTKEKQKKASFKLANSLESLPGEKLFWPEALNDKQMLRKFINEAHSMIERHPDKDYNHFLKKSIKNASKIEEDEEMIESGAAEEVLQRIHHHVKSEKVIEGCCNVFFKLKGLNNVIEEKPNLVWKNIIVCYEGARDLFE